VTLIVRTRRKIPHRLVFNSPVPRWFGHTAMTAWPFIWCANPTIGPELYAHEYCHVLQQLTTSGIAAGLFIVGTVFGWWQVWLVVLSPLGFVLPYLAFQWTKGYERNPFEVRAREWGKEHASEFAS
jgi:hypothetical protein